MTMSQSKWEKCLLGEFLTLQRGFDLPNRLRVAGDIPIVSSAGISDYHNRAMAGQPGVVTGRYGTIGEVFYIDRDYWPLNTTLFVSDFKGNYPLYVSYLLKTIDFKSHSGKSGVPGVNRNDIHQIEITKPSYEEQVKIAHNLADIDSLITSVEKLIAKKRAIKTATMQQLLTGKKRLPEFERREDGTLKEYKSSELGEIPEDWAVIDLGSVSTKVGSGVTPKGGSSVYLESGIPFVRSQNVGWGVLRLDDLAYIGEGVHQTFSGTEIKLGDVLLNITGASIGRSSLADERIVGGNVNQHVCIIRVDSTLAHAQLINCLLLSSMGQHQIDSYQSGGNREGLNFSQIRTMKFAISQDINEQSGICAIFKEIDDDIISLEKLVAKQRIIKQSMMQELLTGRTRLV